MKQKIKVKRINKNIPLPEVIEKGDWVDLRAAETVHLNAPQAGTLKRHTVDGVEVSHRDVTFDSKLIGLGVAMQLPKGLEAVALSRSSSFKNFGVILANSEGVIDQPYCGDNDEWRFNAIALRDTTINEGDRICQFRVQLSQKATMWQKIKWLLSSGIEVVEVDELDNPDREGIGSTGTR
jgi:dUTP pyrophosphatase